MKQALYQFIYHPFVNKILRNINKFLSLVLPDSVRIPPAGTLAVKLKSSQFKFVTNQTNKTSQLLFWNGPYTVEYTSIFEDLIKNCTCYYDIGAHAGYYSILAATVNPNIKVIAFEPASGPFYYLNKNIEANHLIDRVKPFALAIGNEVGKVEFLEATHSKYTYLMHNLIAVSNLNIEQPGRSMKKITVEISTLDHFIEKQKEPWPDIIKMDTEGTEHLILKGATEVLKRKPIIISETLFKTNEEPLEGIMRQNGYQFFNYLAGKLHPVPTLFRESDNGVHDCFFVHPEKYHLIQKYLTN
ncbi:MAG: FkbM family methyltransferase [Bacteroidia bacterium]|nr:FkbM family methyltransferase [Bacteroidia bacterium]